MNAKKPGHADESRKRARTVFAEHMTGLGPGEEVDQRSFRHPRENDVVDSVANEGSRYFSRAHFAPIANRFLRLPNSFVS